MPRVLARHTYCEHTKQPSKPRIFPHRHAALRPYEHYIPISRDLADLRAQLRYARVHDAAAARMAARARRLAARILSQRSVADYAREVLVAYAGLLSFEVRLHPEAVEVPLADD